MWRLLRLDNHTSIIAKHPRGTIEEYSHHVESLTEINHLLGGLTSNHKSVRSIGGRFYSLLLLAKGNTRCLVDKMNKARHGSTCDKLTVEIGILVGSSTHKLNSSYRLDRTEFFSGFTINIVALVILNRGSHTFMVRDSIIETCSTRKIATKVAVPAFKPIKMALMRRTTIMATPKCISKCSKVTNH
jgi:hypothetical protein